MAESGGFGYSEHYRHHPPRHRPVIAAGWQGTPVAAPPSAIAMSLLKPTLALCVLLFALLLAQRTMAHTPPSPAQQFLPLVHRESCPPFFEDFSTTDQGWLEGGIFVQEYGYTNDEYFMRLFAPGFVAGVPMPLPCTTQSAAAQVTGRWWGDAGQGFGIQFGPVSTPTLYYIFEVNPATATYRVLQRTPGGTSVFIADTPTPALEAGQPATLHVRLLHEVVVLSVNGVPLEEFAYLDGGAVQFGLTIATTNSQPALPVEARFDEVRVYVP